MTLIMAGYDNTAQYNKNIQSANSEVKVDSGVSKSICDRESCISGPKVVQRSGQMRPDLHECTNIQLATVGYSGL